MHYLAKRSDLESTARQLFKAIDNGVIDANINYEYPLKDAVHAHKAIESGIHTRSNATDSILNLKKSLNSLILMLLWPI